MNTEQERAEFEAWAEQRGMELHKVSPCDGSPPYYADTPCIAAWEAWQARAAMQSQDRADAPDMFWNDADPENYGGDSLHDAVIYATDDFSASDLPLDMVFRCAKRLPNIAIRVTARDEKDAPVYEVVDHARRVEGEGE